MGIGFLMVIDVSDGVGWCFVLFIVCVGLIKGFIDVVVIVVGVLFLCDLLFFMGLVGFEGFEFRVEFVKFECVILKFKCMFLVDNDGCVVNDIWKVWSVVFLMGDGKLV